MTKKAGTGVSAPKINVPTAAAISGSFLSGKPSESKLMSLPYLTIDTGAMMSLSAFVIPVLLDTDQDAKHMVRQWARLYHYGHIYLPALCVSTTGLYVYTSLSKRVVNNKQWSRYALAATSTIAMVPFTWLVMTATNNTLFRLDASELVMELGLVRGLVVRWAWLHVTRSLFPLVGAILGFMTLLQELRSG